MKVKSNNSPMFFTHTFNRLITLMLLLMLSLRVNAQHYPSAYPVPAQKLNQLLADLKASQNDDEKIQTLLNLSNLYFNKPLRRDADVAKALNYAKQADRLSTATHNVKGVNQAKAVLADIFADKNEMEAAENILPKVNDTTRLNLLIMLGYRSYFFTSDITDKNYKKGLSYLDNAAALAIKLHDKKKELWAKTLSVYMNTYSKPDNGYAAFEKLSKEYKAAKLPYLPIMYTLLAAFYGTHGRMDKCLSVLQKGVDYMRATRDTLLLGDCLVMMGEIQSNMGQQTKSIDYYKQGLAQYRVHTGEISIPEVINFIAGRLQTLNKKQEALAFIFKSMSEYPPEHAAEKAKYQQYIGKAYESLGNYPLAEKYLILSYNTLKKNNSTGDEDERQMAEFLIRVKKYAAAAPYLKRYFAYKMHISMPRLAHAEYMAYMVDSAAANYKSAMAHLSKSKYMDNEMLSEKKNRDVMNLSIKYETAKKDGKINLLTQKAKYEAANAKQANQVKNLLFAGILLVLIIAGLLYRQNGLKQKNNEIIIHKNKLLERLVEEKEWLLKEVHHRVKNNLHTVICLLESQAVYLENDALKAIESSQHRIYAMSLIHQKLYQTDDIKTIDMDVYLNEFIQYLSSSFGDPANIRLELDIESVKLGAVQAIPVGLIINEAVTNAYKYAFPNNRNGNIKIALHQAKNLIELIIRDNGIGMQTAETFEEATSLGMELIKGLCRELNGKLKLDGNNGTSLSILFELNLLDKVGSAHKLPVLTQPI